MEEEKFSPQHYTPGSRKCPGRKSWGRKSCGKGQRKGNKEIPSTALSHDFIKNWEFSKSRQDLLPQGDKKTKNKNKKQTKQKTPKKPKHLQSIFLAGSRSKSSRYLHKGPTMYENRMTSFPWVMVMRVWCPEAQMRYQGP